MAKPDWLTVRPMSGRGNAVLTNSAAMHCGRLAREGMVTVRGGSIERTYIARQEGIGEEIEIETSGFQAIVENGVRKWVGSVPNEECSFVVMGYTNSARILPTVTSDPSGLISSTQSSNRYIRYCPYAQKEQGLQHLNDMPSVLIGQPFPNDPGAQERLYFRFGVDFTHNTTEDEREAVICLTGNNDVRTYIKFKQPGAGLSLDRSSADLTYEGDGEGVGLTADSNLDWEVS